MKQEVYRSSTLGDIPLSFTGRRLLANLRDAFEQLLKTAVNSDVKSNWEPVSLARGNLAKYISALEQRAPSNLRDYQKEAMNENFGSFAHVNRIFGGKGPKVRVHHVNSLEEAQKIMDQYEAGEMPCETLEPAKEPEAESKSQTHEAPNGSTFVLPDIPENYVLRMVGGMLVIEPLSIAELQEKAGFVPNKPSPIGFCSLLDEYREAIQQIGYQVAPKGQERIDKARMAVIQAYESKST